METSATIIWRVDSSMNQQLTTAYYCLAQAPGSAASILRALTNLHALRRLEADQGWLLTEGILSLDAARGIPNEIRCAAVDSMLHSLFLEI